MLLFHTRRIVSSGRGTATHTHLYVYIELYSPQTELATYALYLGVSHQEATRLVYPLAAETSLICPLHGPLSAVGVLICGLAGPADEKGGE